MTLDINATHAVNRQTDVRAKLTSTSDPSGEGEPGLSDSAIFSVLVIDPGAPARPDLTVNLANLTNSLGQGYQLLTAAAFFSMIVPLVVFLSLQRYFVRGILAGSVKG